MLRFFRALPKAHKIALAAAGSAVVLLTVTGLSDRSEPMTPAQQQLANAASDWLSQRNLAYNMLSSYQGNNCQLTDSPLRSAYDDAPGLDTVLINGNLATTRPPCLTSEAYLIAATSYVDYGDLALFGDDGQNFSDELTWHTITPDLQDRWDSYQVKAGDTFAAVAQRELGLGYSEAMQVLAALPEQRLLTHWRVGDKLEFQRDRDGKLSSLRLMKDARTGYLIERDLDEQFAIIDIRKKGEATQRMVAGSVSGSFAASARAAGLSAGEVAQLTNLLSKRLDFRRDARAGDAFQVLVESEVVDGRNFDTRIMAARYTGARMNLTVLRNPDDNQFYTPDGKGIEPAFDRYPFAGNFRISSAYNLNRRHPITRRIAPHRGTDFAMPIGTPIQSPADGRVERVGNDPIAGRFMVIRHYNGYQTRYLHLHRTLVRPGTRVEKGQRIALSGNTGRSTGPHLHYEVLVNNQQVNPMRVALPESRALSGRELVAFQRQTQVIVAALDGGETGTLMLAASGQRSTPPDEG